MQSTSLSTLPVLIVACLGGASALLANLVSITMVAKINEGLPEGKQLSIFWWGTELRKEFRQRYPLSRLVLIRDLCFGLMLNPQFRGFIPRVWQVYAASSQFAE